MEITVVVPGESWFDSAGVRIRYGRLQPALERLGHRLVLKVIDDFHARRSFRSEAYLFCKCYDARALLLAQAIHAAGRPVGIDVFDDYFSQWSDPRLVHMRRWFADILPSLHFALCATEVMAARLKALAPGLRAHVLTDPSPFVDEADIAAAIERKAAEARASSVVSLGWFGVGDNPYFSVGLDDLSAWGAALTEVRSAGLEPRLQILTNPRALTPQGLQVIARLPVPAQISEWSLEAEAALLAESFAVFLPVNAQPFSTAKSLNRAITALVGGAQVWSAGYPLYEELSDFIYRSGLDLARDLSTGQLRLRRATISQLADLLDKAGEPGLEADRLVDFLSGLNIAEAPVAVIHGVQSDIAVHKWAQRSGYLSVASPFASAKLNYDLRFEDEVGLWAVLSERAYGYLDPALAARLEEPLSINKMSVRRLFLGAEVLPGLGARGMAERIGLYPAALATTQTLVEHLLPRCRIIISERASPFGELSSTERAL